MKYRILKRGEIVQKEDEFWNLVHLRWEKTCIPGKKVNTAKYRRPLKKSIDHRYVWVMESYKNGKWEPYGMYFNRKNARFGAEYLRSTGFKARVRKYTPE